MFNREHIRDNSPTGLISRGSALVFFLAGLLGGFFSRGFFLGRCRLFGESHSHQFQLFQNRIDPRTWARRISNSLLGLYRWPCPQNSETAQALFRLVNIIVEKMITEPKVIQAVYDSLPASKLKGIEDRDS